MSSLMVPITICTRIHSSEGSPPSSTKVLKFLEALNPLSALYDLRIFIAHDVNSPLTKELEEHPMVKAHVTTILGETAC